MTGDKPNGDKQPVKVTEEYRWDSENRLKQFQEDGRTVDFLYSGYRKSLATGSCQLMRLRRDLSEHRLKEPATEIFTTLQAREP